MAKVLRYKDMNCAQGTELYDALERGDNKKAAELYKRHNAQFHRDFPLDIWQRVKEQMNVQKESADS